MNLIRQIACGAVSVAALLAVDAPATSAQSPALTGVASCTAAGCHGAAHPDSVVGSEYNVWIADDPHARAYNVLFEPESARMIRLLDGKPAGAPVAPHEDNRCLVCHSMTHWQPVDPQLDIVTDGVSCEACHGPAEQWLAVHYEPEFLATDGATREIEYGFWDTDSLSRRAAICADCHVGSPGRDVNHDLIASGHPRLQFEMGAYFHALPKHWDDAKDRSRLGPEFDAVVWAVGQATTSQAALELLAARAAEGRIWPEFAEWSCAACHHDLRDETAQQERLAEESGLSGRRIAWNDWNHHFTRRYLAEVAQVLGVDDELTAEIRREFDSLDDTMRSLDADRAQVADGATSVAERLGRWAVLVENSKWNPTTTDRLSRAVLRGERGQRATRWSAAAQAYDALASLHQSRLNRRAGNDTELTRAIARMYDGLRGRVELPASYRYDAEQIAQQLAEVQRLLRPEGGER